MAKFGEAFPDHGLLLVVDDYLITYAPARIRS